MKNEHFKIISHGEELTYPILRIAGTAVMFFLFGIYVGYGLGAFY